MNHTPDLNAFVSGAMTMGYIVICLYFLRFWRRSSDRLFAFFALAFFVLAAQRFSLAFTTQNSENTLPLYAARLLAFLLILAAIIDKNRSGSGGSAPDDTE